ncbi:HXXEE domain-containing protein [Ruania zhangjianzhongii]|uniref:HXXEE domain-containing protein n=1 Tax=Ruania zhangjianzhongii TaxID=2603206 RepID=UPI0011C7F34D|nr:HXXEE domain-containing protein [Ruania zhangjianzhongii]
MTKMLKSAEANPRAVTPRRLGLLWALMVSGLALHNAEEWLFGLTGWMADHPWLPGRSLHGDQAQFAIALAIVTAAVLVIALIAVATRARWSEGVLVSVAYALMINAGSHVVLSVVSWSLMPGTLSGALLLLPLGLLVVRSLPVMPWTTTSLVLTVVAAVVLVMGSLAAAAGIGAALGVLR